jgi:hypothetical protein
MKNNLNSQRLKTLKNDLNLILNVKKETNKVETTAFNITEQFYDHNYCIKLN